MIDVDQWSMIDYWWWSKIHNWWLMINGRWIMIDDRWLMIDDDQWLWLSMLDDCQCLMIIIDYDPWLILIEQWLMVEDYWFDHFLS